MANGWFGFGIGLLLSISGQKNHLPQKNQGKPSNYELNQKKKAKTPNPIMNHIPSHFNFFKTKSPPPVAGYHQRYQRFVSRTTPHGRTNPSSPIAAPAADPAVGQRTAALGSACPAWAARPGEAGKLHHQNT